MMITRRNFINSVSKAIVYSAALPNLVAAALNQARRPIGLQLFTLLGIIEEDVPGNLKRIADIGYQEIESAFSSKGDYYGMKPKEFASLCQQNGLSWKSHHVLGAPIKLPKDTKMPTMPGGKPLVIPPMKTLSQNMQQLVDEAAEGGVEYLVCASMPTSTLDEILETVRILHKTGEACKKAGITFAYHNHEDEFKPIQNSVPYDLILQSTEPDLVKMELDLAWATKAGVDPVSIFEKNPGRFPLLHVKDISQDLTTIKPVGSGIIDFKRIFDHAETAGVKHIFVEHDMPADAYSSISSSYIYLRTLNI